MILLRRRRTNALHRAVHIDRNIHPRIAETLQPNVSATNLHRSEFPRQGRPRARSALGKMGDRLAIQVDHRTRHQERSESSATPIRSETGRNLLRRKDGHLSPAQVQFDITQHHLAVAQSNRPNPQPQRGIIGPHSPAQSGGRPLPCHPARAKRRHRHYGQNPTQPPAPVRPRFGFLVFHSPKMPPLPPSLKLNPRPSL